jgi:hypothetical protein
MQRVRATLWSLPRARSTLVATAPRR